MSIEINQIVHSKRKTLALIVRNDGSLVVRAPLRASNSTIREFVERHAEWIKKKQADALAVVPLVPRQYVAGELFPYLGNYYPLEILKSQKESLRLEASFKLAESARGNAARVFERWYREEARRILQERVTFFASEYDLQYRKIGITSARTRWGSCSADGSLNFSWRLIMAPMDAVDYVVVHELVHTVFHNHSKRFWDRVGTIMPDYIERRKLLRNNGIPFVL
jgi:predicted metal-dependent hydrolase